MKLGLDAHNRTDRLFITILIILIVSELLILYSLTVTGSANLVNVLTSLLAVSFPVLTIAIAYDSYKLNRNNHRLALFDKRYKVYTALKNLLASIAGTGRLSKEVSNDFRGKHLEAKFLFERDILDYLSEIESKMNDFEYRQGRQNGDSEKKDLLFDYFVKELVECDNKFMKYLSFREL